jgi:tripartite ATP-independent periplasmic transporter solute receptor, DctP family
MKSLVSALSIAAAAGLFASPVLAQEFEITMGSTGQTSTAMYRAAEEFEKAVEGRTEGRVAVELAFAGVFGGDRENAELTQLGEIQMVWTSDIGLGTLIPEIGFSTLPFMFPDYAAVDEYYLNGFVGEAFTEVLLRNGLRVIGWGENDYRELTTSGVAVTEAEHLAGLKLRVPQFPSLLSFFQKLGAAPTPMAFTEVFTALQQGTIDGQDNGPIQTESQRFHEAQDHYTWTNHVYSAAPIVINDDFYQSLPDDIRAIIDEEGARVAALQVEWNRADVQGAVERMQADGIEVHELSPAAVARFREVAQEVWAEFAPQYEPSVMERIQAEFSVN